MNSHNWRLTNEEEKPPTKKLCSCGADLSSLSDCECHVRKHLASQTLARGSGTESSTWLARGS